MICILFVGVSECVPNTFSFFCCWAGFLAIGVCQVMLTNGFDTNMSNEECPIKMCIFMHMNV